MVLLVQHNALSQRIFPLFCNPDITTVTAVGLRLPASTWKQCVPTYTRDETFSSCTDWEELAHSYNVGIDGLTLQGWMHVERLNVGWTNIPLKALATVISLTTHLTEINVQGWTATGISTLSFSLLAVELSGAMDGVKMINVDECKWFDNKCLWELIRGRKLHALQLLSCRGTGVTLDSVEAARILRRNGGVTKVLTGNGGVDVDDPAEVQMLVA